MEKSRSALFEAHIRCFCCIVIAGRLTEISESTELRKRA